MDAKLHIRVDSKAVVDLPHQRNGAFHVSRAEKERLPMRLQPFDRRRFIGWFGPLRRVRAWPLIVVATSSPGVAPELLS